MMGVGMRDQPVVSHEADLRQQSLEFRKPSCGVVVQYSHAVATPHRLHLCHHAPALVVPVHEFSERRRVVERSTVDEILDMRDEEMAGEIGLFPDRSQALQITLTISRPCFGWSSVIAMSASRLDSENVRGKGTS